MSLSLIKKIKSEKLLRDNLKMTENWAECSTQLCKFFLCRPVMSVLQMDIFVFELAYVLYILAFLNQIESFHKLHIKPNKMDST